MPPLRWACYEYEFMTDENTFSRLVTSMNRALLLDIAIRDVEDYILMRRQETVVDYNELIRQLPREEEERDCAICLETCVDPLCRLECSHCFCESCLVTWLPVRNACPLCRRAVAPTTSDRVVLIPDVQAGLRLLRQLVYAMMCEETREALELD